MGGGLQLALASRPRAGEQPQVAALAPGGAGQLLQQTRRLVQLAHPQQAAESAPVHHQGEGQLQVPGLGRQPLQGEQIRQGIAGMASVADPLQPPPFRGPQPRRSAGQHPLSQGRRTSRQRIPAAPGPGPILRAVAHVPDLIGGKAEGVQGDPEGQGRWLGGPGAAGDHHPLEPIGQPQAIEQRLQPAVEVADDGEAQSRCLPALQDGGHIRIDVPEGGIGEAVEEGVMKGGRSPEGTSGPRPCRRQHRIDALPPPGPLGLEQVGAVQAGEGQGRSLPQDSGKGTVDGLGADGDAMLGRQAGVGVADGGPQADEGAHGIEQQAPGPRPRRRGGARRGHGVQSASQPAATRSWWERPGRRVR